MLEHFLETKDIERQGIRFCFKDILKWKNFDIIKNKKCQLKHKYGCANILALYLPKKRVTIMIFGKLS